MQETILVMLDERDIDPRDACLSCNGSGIKMYGSTSTWRGGIGGAACTRDQCDVCWGSGSKTKPWPSIKDLEAQRRDWEADQCVKWLSSQVGSGYKTVKENIKFLIEILEKEEKRRKVPEGADAFWYKQTMRIFISFFKKLSKDA